MKKIFLMLLLISLLIGVSACDQIMQTSDQTLFEEHLVANQTLYEERMAYMNHLSNEVVFSVVKVVKNGTRVSGSNIGSGVIYKKTDTHYYVLTNEHVIDDPFMNRVTYEIYDYQGRSHQAALIAHDAAYDLAVLRFEIKSFELRVALFADNDPIQSDFLAVLGHPEGMFNALSLGSAIDYDFIEIDTERDVAIAFDTLVTNVPVQSGSSGSPVFSRDFEIVGLVYAASVRESTNISRYTYVVQVSKIKEFLEANASKGVNL
ncbi:MAG: S1 family peptidase [Acholeplasmataceae bacterium]